MSETTTLQEPALKETGSEAGSNGSEGAFGGAGIGDAAANFAERYSDVIGKINTTLDQVDWVLMGRVAKGTGVVLAVIVAQILIKGVLDTINLLPVVPGLLELLGLVVVGQWSWKNLTTSEKRSAVLANVQKLRQEYLG
ncbi:MAG: CAAD domain-containing protein [Synechococcus sp.]